MTDGVDVCEGPSEVVDCDGCESDVGCEGEVVVACVGS